MKISVATTVLAAFVALATTSSVVASFVSVESPEENAGKVLNEIDLGK